MGKFHWTQYHEFFFSLFVVQASSSPGTPNQRQQDKTTSEEVRRSPLLSLTFSLSLSICVLAPFWRLISALCASPVFFPKLCRVFSLALSAFYVDTCCPHQALLPHPPKKKYFKTWWLQLYNKSTFHILKGNLLSLSS